MRRQTRAGWYAFSLDPDKPGRRPGAGARWTGGSRPRRRVILLRAGGRRAGVAPVAELPVTFGGLSHLQRGQCAGRGGCRRRAGLLGQPRSRPACAPSRWTRARIPARLNLYERRGRLVLIDFAHNEAGLQGLARVSDQLVTRSAWRAAARFGWRSARRVTGPMRSCATWAAGRRRRRRHRHLREAPLPARARPGGDEPDPARRRGGGRVTRRKVKRLPERADRPAGAGEARQAAATWSAVMTHVERTEIADWLASAGYRAGAA